MADTKKNSEKTEKEEVGEDNYATASPSTETVTPKGRTKGEKVADVMLKSKEIKTDKYDSVRVISRFAKLIGVLFFIIYAFVGISALINNWFWDGVYYFFSSAAMGLIYLIVGFIFGDILQVLIDIEKNTRKEK